MDILDLDKWSLINIKDRLAEMKEKEDAKLHVEPDVKPRIISVRKLIKPVDLYCYLVARFGEPNGFQSFMLNNADPKFPDPDSGNLIHWDYEVVSEKARLSITGLTREVHFSSSNSMSDAQWLELFAKLKKDFGKYAKEKSEIHKRLEKWIIFQNPYVAIANVCAELHGEIITSEEVASQFVEMGPSSVDSEEYQAQMKNAAERAMAIYGNTLQLRILTPVLGEAFLNVLAEMLLKKEIRHDKEKWGEWKSRRLNAKLDTLHEDFRGFKKALDKDTDFYKSFMRVRARRNDDLHANILPSRDKLETLFFDGKIPLYSDPGDIFQKYWQNYERLIQPSKVIADYEAVHGFFIEILSNIAFPFKGELLMMLDEPFPGFNPTTQRYGKLFPDRIAHFSLGNVVQYDDQLVAAE